MKSLGIDTYLPIYVPRKLASIAAITSAENTTLFRRGYSYGYGWLGSRLPLSLGFGLGNGPHKLRQALMVEVGDRRQILFSPIDGEIALVRHQASQNGGVGRARV